jgi:hypothetical protein
MTKLKDAQDKGSPTETDGGATAVK